MWNKRLKQHKRNFSKFQEEKKFFFEGKTTIVNQSPEKFESVNPTGTTDALSESSLTSKMDLFADLAIV